MYYFNVVIYTENEKIKIKLEKIQEINSDAAQPIQISVKSFSFIDFTKDGYPLFIDEEVRRRSVTNTFKALKFGYGGVGYGGEDKEQEYLLESFIYELPTDEKMALNLMAVLDIFEQQCRNEPLMRNKSIDGYIKSQHLNQGIAQFFDVSTPYYASNRSNIEKKTMAFYNRHIILSHFLSLTILEQSYQPILKTLKNIFNKAHCVNPDLNLHDYLMDTRFNKEIATNPLQFQTLFKTTPPASQTNKPKITP